MFLCICLRKFFLLFNVLNETVEENVHLPLDISPKLCRNKENTMADIIISFTNKENGDAYPIHFVF